MRDEKLHAVVARSTFGSQNVQGTSKHLMFRSPLEVEMSTFRNQKCKKLRGTGALQMSFRVASARDCAPCQGWANREGFVAVSAATTTLQPQRQLQLHYITLHYVTLHYITLHYVTLHCFTLHYTTLTTTKTTKNTTLHYTNYTTLRYTPLHFTTLQDTTLNYTTLQLQLHYTTLH